MDNSHGDTEVDATILDGFAPRETFADDNGTTTRTVDRYRSEGLPWVNWNGRIYIGPLDEARAWLMSRVRRTTGKAA
jgi:hypothetical protein